MSRYFSLPLFIGLVFWSCDDENDNNDTIPPSIQILSPLDAETVTNNTIVLSENTIIDVDAYDNKSIHRVEFYIKKKIFQFVLHVQILWFTLILMPHLFFLGYL